VQFIEQGAAAGKELVPSHWNMPDRWQLQTSVGGGGAHGERKLDNVHPQDLGEPTADVRLG
jgi:hypothetical protein